MVLILSLILFFLLVIIGKERGFKTFISFFVSLIIIVLYILFISLGLNIIILTLITCIIALLFITFYLNGYNIKTKSAFISTLIVFTIMFILTYILVNSANIQGFSEDSIETIGGFGFDININMIDLAIGTLLVSIIGTIIDTSVSVATALYEVHINNPDLTKNELFTSGMNIGKDILGTTINTLYFALVMNLIGFFIWHRNISLEYVINYKAFNQFIVEMLICFIASIIIIPLTSYIASYMYKKKTID